MNRSLVTATGESRSSDPDFNPDLSLDKCEVANYFIEDILSLLCLINKAEGGEVPGEKQMRELLMVNWASGSDKALKEALDLIGTGDSKFTEANLKKLDKLLDKTLAAEFAYPVDKKLAPLVTQYYKKAKESLHKKGLSSIWGSVDDTATKWLHEHHVYWVYGYYDKHLSKAMSVKVAEGMAEGLGRESIGEIMRDFFDNYPGVGQRPLSYWNMFAANGMNRSRQFGLIQGWVDLGIKELEVVAVIDERTTPICREMNGRIIPVGRAVDQRDALIAVEDPEDVKSISPWLSEKEIKDLSEKPTKTLMDKGQIVPPYHANCRTTLVER